MFLLEKSFFSRNGLQEEQEIPVSRLKIGEVEEQFSAVSQVTLTNMWSYCICLMAALASCHFLFEFFNTCSGLYESTGHAL